MKNYDLLIIGGGCAGLAAAIAAHKSGVQHIALTERNENLGGILNQCIHEGFGLELFDTELTGPQFAERLIEDFSKTDVTVYTGTTVLELTADTAVLSGKNGYFEISFRAVILACGCRETPIGALPVTGTRPSGIFTAGQAQSMINLKKYDIGNNILILGAGDVGMIVARRLKLLGKNVIAVLEKSNQCGGLERNLVNCLKKHGIPLHTNCTVTKIYGTSRITGADVKDLLTDNISHIPCDTLITSVGLVPERDLLDSFGDRVLPKNIFLCGNCRTVHDTADAACLDGNEAGAAAAVFIATGVRPPIKHRYIGTRPLAQDETVCLDCPRGCILTVKSGETHGGKCKKFK